MLCAEMDACDLVQQYGFKKTFVYTTKKIKVNEKTKKTPEFGRGVFG